MVTGQGTLLACWLACLLAAKTGAYPTQIVYCDGTHAKPNRANPPGPFTQRRMLFVLLSRYFHFFLFLSSNTTVNTSKEAGNRQITSPK